MTEVISVRFRGGCKNYYFNPNGNQVKMGDQVIVETAQGPEFATCTEGNHEVEDSAIVKPLSPMLRMATDSDRRTVEQNIEHFFLIKMCHHQRGMHPRVCSPGTYHFHITTQKSRQSFHQAFLHTTPVGLYLPTVIVGSIISQINKIPLHADSLF